MASLLRNQFLAAVREAQNAYPEAASRGLLAVPLSVRLLADQLTPSVAYRRLVAEDPREAPSFLFESVENGDRIGRYSLLGVSPTLEVSARGQDVEVRDHGSGLLSEGDRHQDRHGDPLGVLRALASRIVLCRAHADQHGQRLPTCPLGGWFGYAAYDTVRYAEPERLGNPPTDDRLLPDMHFGFYNGVVAFDHVSNVLDVVQLALIGPGDDPDQAYDRAMALAEQRASRIESAVKILPAGRLGRELPATAMASNTTREQHREMIERAMEYIRAGDVFQVVLGQRFERASAADPFDVYRALRSVNPSPYMVYLQAQRCILVASSPEILCRVKHTQAGADGQSERIVTNRPLAGTRHRGQTPEQDEQLRLDLLADEKERAEHVMLVDLGRNDVGVVSRPASVRLEKLMEVERYSHVMHLSSTVTGVLREGLDAWDALRAALPVGTISGAPKIRAMQVIDELEPVRRGPYGGGMGYVDLEGDMDIALALRTIVVPTDLRSADQQGRTIWTYHIQASGGIVADSQIDAEYQETVNKAAALGRAIDVAESAFAEEGVQSGGLGL